jgi:hypothetical protein
MLSLLSNASFVMMLTQMQSSWIAAMEARVFDAQKKFKKNPHNALFVERLVNVIINSPCLQLYLLTTERKIQK